MLLYLLLSSLVVIVVEDYYLYTCCLYSYYDLYYCIVIYWLCISTILYSDLFNYLSFLLYIEVCTNACISCSF